MIALSFAGGLAVALSVPPWGFWPLGPVGIALLATGVLGGSVRWGKRAVAAACFGVALFAPTLFWMSEFHAVGYVAVVLLQTSFFVVLLALTGRTAAGLALGIALAELARGHVPFGGLPMGGIPLGQVGGPLLPAARLGGDVMLTALVAFLGVGLSLAMRHRRPVGLAGAVAVSFAFVALASVAPDGDATGRTLRVAVVQGGGPRGFRAVESDAGDVLARHLDASAALEPPVDLVVWPENAIDIDAIKGSETSRLMGAIAQQLDATIVAGVTEDVTDERFQNVAVAWDPNGGIADSYVKTHRVPFGEYVPGRALFERLADLSVLPRDAVSGTGPPVLKTSAGALGVSVSYEVFFTARARHAVRSGAQVLLVPTNAASFTSSQVPTQELNAARLRAVETGRWVVQSAPTGYSAIVDPNGKVVTRSTLGRQQILTATVPLRTGQTVATTTSPGVELLALLAALAALGSRLRRRPDPRSPSA